MKGFACPHCIAPYHNIDSFRWHIREYHKSKLESCSPTSPVSSPAPLVSSYDYLNRKCNGCENVTPLIILEKLNNFIHKQWGELYLDNFR